MPFVLDASAAAAWVLKEPAHPSILAALTSIAVDSAFVPTLWWYEIRNVLLMSERRGRTLPSDADQLLDQLATLDVILDHERNQADVFALARRHNLTFYDAAYLELAVRERLALATLDSALAKAARAEGVPLIGEGA